MFLSILLLLIMFCPALSSSKLMPITDDLWVFALISIFITFPICPSISLSVASILAVSITLAFYFILIYNQVQLCHICLSGQVLYQYLLWSHRKDIGLQLSTETWVSQVVIILHCFVGYWNVFSPYMQNI